MNGRFNGSGENAAAQLCPNSAVGTASEGGAPRRADEIDDDVIHMLEQEFDGTELAAATPAETRSSRADAVRDVLMDSGIVTNWHLQFFAAAVYSPIP
ncbi:MAG: hypothetical protein ACJ8EW_08140 [Rhizobium sp.]|uniref:hypothetical protein n=1 Tax=unclassified Rhizobium TaxID=2613769 RepID=UPI0021A51382|nr:hypothetical protein [Rhizobium leguminosarum]UWU27159.1 hypothetical protein N2600_17485 [Rhizobium leguminosarum bv. viciae]